MKNYFYAIIDGSSYDAELYPLSRQRSTSSIPFFGRYRLIDFIISSLTHSGCKNIAIYTGHAANSLHDHLGDGAPWNLNTHKDGLFILDTPFTHRSNVVPYNALKKNRTHLDQSTQDYVIFCHGLGIHQIRYEPLFEQHIKSNADITCLTSGSENINFYIVKRDLLHEFLDTSEMHFELDIRDTANKRKGIKVEVIEIKDLYAEITSVKEYFNVSLGLLHLFTHDDFYKRILHDEDLILRTKRNHSMPTLFTGDSRLINSTVADGCMIHGEVTESIISRNVTINKKSKINSSIIMSNAVIGSNCKLDYVIVDKNARIADGTTLIGTKDLPQYVAKGEAV